MLPGNKGLAHALRELRSAHGCIDVLCPDVSVLDRDTKSLLSTSPFANNKTIGSVLVLLTRRGDAFLPCLSFQL